MGYALHIQGIYMYMSGIFREITSHYFHGELCCVGKLCLLHSIALNHGMGLLHWNSKIYIKLEFWYTWHIHSIYHVYTVALHIHGIYLAYTDYIPHHSRGSRRDHLESWTVVRTQYNPVRTDLYSGIVSYWLVLLRLSMYFFPQVRTRTYFFPQVRTQYVLGQIVCTEYVLSTESMIKVRTLGEKYKLS
jgi:hypothetical protein